MKCEDCNVELTMENQAGEDEYAVYCKTCWGERPDWEPVWEPDWEPVCDTCGVKMVQSNDLWTIYCPVSDDHPKILLKPC